MKKTAETPNVEKITLSVNAIHAWRALHLTLWLEFIGELARNGYAFQPIRVFQRRECGCLYESLGLEVWSPDDEVGKPGRLVKLDARCGYIDVDGQAHKLTIHNARGLVRLVDGIDVRRVLSDPIPLTYKITGGQLDLIG